MSSPISSSSGAARRELLNRLLGKDSTGQIGWLRATAKKDLTPQFQTAYADALSGAPALPREARDHVYLVIEGLLAQTLPGYMDENERSLQALGLETRRVKIDTEAPVPANAREIVRAIEKVARSGRKAVLVCHSKGGVDAAAALALRPELARNVRALVTVQSPYGGSPIATDIASCPHLLTVAAAVMTRLLSGRKRALLDLSYERRQDFVRKHPYPNTVPTLCLVSESRDPRSVVAPAAAYVYARYGEPNDGLVPAKDQLIPGASVVRLKGLDHAAPVWPDWKSPSQYRAGPLTQALVSVALQGA